MYKLFETPLFNRSDGIFKDSKISVEYSEYSGKWFISHKSADKSVTVTKTYGACGYSGYQILEAALNLSEPKVYKDKLDEYGRIMFDKNNKPIRVIDVPATQVVQQKANKIRREFKNWLFSDPVRRSDIVDTYNRTFNCIKPREYDGSHLTFPGMNSNIELHEHQKNAIAHAIYGGNTLFAHSVGAGKTFEMIATAMECKRLGLCHKSLFAVPNHLTEQVGNDFIKLYPNANILVATKDDFKAENRKRLMSKIATGNYDAVIIGHTQLKMLPLSPERQENIFKEQIDNIVAGIVELKYQEGNSFKVKDMERTKRSLEQQLEKLQSSKKDNTVYFEELGIDKLFVDEAHEFKNLFCTTKLQNVSGISSRASQRATELFAKCRYLDEKTGGKGVVFATGTPLSNSVTELHTMMRYLNYDFLASHNNMQNFDNWVSTFGVQKKEYELAPAGNKFKERTRIAEYANLPELMSMFKTIADVRTADTLNLKVPDCELHIVDVEPTELQTELVEELSVRADEVNNGSVDPSTDNMLKITGDGRKLGLDPRLINPSFEDDPGTKLNVCVNNVFDIYEKTSDKKLTQIVFCDLGVPSKNSSADGNKDDDTKSVAELDSLEESGKFCVYDDIRDMETVKNIPFDVKTESYRVGITIGKDAYSLRDDESRKVAAKALTNAVAQVKGDANKNKRIAIGELGNFGVEIINDGYFLDKITATLRGNYTYSVELGVSSIINLKKIENLLFKVENVLNDKKSELNKLDIDYKTAQNMLHKPFEFEDELNNSTKRLDELTTALNIEMSEHKVDKPKKTHYFGKDFILGKNKSSKQIQNNEAIKSESKRNCQEL